MSLTNRLLKPFILAILFAFLATSSSCIIVDKTSRKRHHTRVKHKSPKHFHKHCHRRGKRGKKRVCHSHAHRHPHH